MITKSTYRTSTWLLILSLAYNIAGWMGMGLANELMHSHHHAEEQCEVTFCYCLTEPGEDTCDCHKAAIPAQGTTDHLGYEPHHSEAPVSDHCVYKNDHKKTDSGITLPILSSHTGILPPGNGLILISESGTNKGYYLSRISGPPVSEHFHPPRV